MEEVITQETLTDVVDVATTDGGSADEAGSISLGELSKVLGKEYKDAETALKSVKDTFNYVGDVGKVKNLLNDAKQKLNTDEAGVLNALNKLMEDNTQVTPEVKVAAPAQPSTEGQYLTEAQLNRRLDEVAFFSKNESISEYKDVLAPLKEKFGADMSWSEFVSNNEQAKKVVSTFTGYNEVQSQKSVLESNPRLGVATDKLTEARTLVEQAEASGNVTQAVNAHNQARESAVAGVLEAYELK